MKRRKPVRLHLSHVMHTKIKEETAVILRERAFEIGLDVSAYVRMIVESHLAGDLKVREPKDYVLQKKSKSA